MTLTHATVPEATARSRAGRICAGSLTCSPYPPIASTILSYRVGASVVAGLFSGPKSCTCGSLIWPHAASFPTTTTIGSLKRSAVSKSIPLKPNEPSPWMTNTVRSGCSSLAAMANGAPTPRQPSGPGSSHRPGRRSPITLAAIATQFPPSATNMLSPAARATVSSSRASRK